MKNKLINQINILIAVEITASSKHKKFIEYAYATENETLRKLLLSCASCFDLQSQSNHLTKDWWRVEYLFKRKHALKDYIKLLEKENKPEWQFLAEKNGWVPSGK